MKIFAENRRAKFDYEILETYQAGLVLLGHEVKAIKTGHISLGNSFVIIKNNELYLINSFIPPYQPKNTPSDYDPERSRKLLLQKQEIKSLIGKSKAKGLTLLPLKVYTEKNKLKLEFAIGHGKRKIDKREKIKKRDTEREMERNFRE